ncbi:prepilin-type N-terminal cleavage/methylation domain-containing protein [Roseimicrobium gellanilyticum]|uniref:Prepilin-type N-terminal cleavage/methylation domain-containing protein n=1 Tax=Roseimicrobium gellanilyticum TaxID=748857 RepID=A0A366H1P4_9BACT|nr:prepilin-type N-terminal cleavage/methylation domain-containing protein [Roseimicrobium gellanilyticum]RBP35688.1 prepilin-type N-terminal cleavage/methylation domain-containing protein [Roseimicrobium gellanilyticum]
MNVRSPRPPLPPEFRTAAFTLIELVLVLAILAIILGAAVPSVSGLMQDAEARKPLEDLARLAKQTRLRAMEEKRPYQIAFTGTGYTATRYLSPYLQAAQIDEFIQRTELEAEQKMEAGLTQESGETTESVVAAESSTGGPQQSAPPAAAFKEWTEKHTLPEGMTCSIQYWYEPQATPIEGTEVKLWVFQPTGMVAPLTVTMTTSSGASYSAKFNALTADIVKETSN